jgi:molybdenum cofactor synthesis domain-containing protein
MKRQVYLNLKTVEEAKDLLLAHFGPELRRAPEKIRTEDALGRVTSEPVFARWSAPSFHSAAMDGIAVRARDTYGTTEARPQILKMEEDARWINTGQPLPEGFDAVIMVEKLHQVNPEQMEIRSPAYPWQNVRKVGEDIVATQLLLPQNHRIRPIDLGALISAGVFSLSVWERPRVAIIPTGSELVGHRAVKEGETLGSTQIIEYNSLVLSGMVSECGGVPVVHDIAPDEEEKILHALMAGVQSDAHVIILNAGSSAGSKDYTVHAIGESGSVLVHGVAMMPGKPTILGEVKGKPVIGNPGYSVSSFLSFEHFVKPLLYRLQGLPLPEAERIPVQLTRDVASRMGMEEFLRVNIGKVGSKYVATPLPRAAGSITTLTRAEGILRIPALSEGISQKEPVEAEILVEKQALLNTVVFIGSHDMTIDLLGDEMRRGGRDIRLSAGNVGSLGGLMALKKGICHLSGSHLLETSTGEYNLSYIKRYLKGIRVSVFHLALREQGLMVAEGNPKGIRGLADLGRKDVRFVNRQAGSGTRVLLDFKLAQLGIDPRSIQGYDHEEFTHMAVAVDVLSGAADCGMGIYAASKALGLEFVPVEQEQYDFIIPTDLLAEPKMEVLLQTMRSASFKERVSALGGYDPERSGELWVEMG